MAITTIGSYPPTMIQFKLHWDQANSALGTALLLPGGYDVALFLGDHDAIVAALTNLQDLINDLELAQEDRDVQRENLRDRIINFRQTVESQFPGSRYLRALPDTPPEKASEGKILSPLDDMASLWVKIEADTSLPGFMPPLLLRGNYSLAGFTADLAALRAQYQALSAAERELKLAREDRDQMLEAAYERMKQYRARVEAEFEETDPVRQSLPDLTPPSGGGTALDTFGYNFQPSGSDTVAWFQMPAGVSGVTNVLFREGASEVSTGVVLNPGQSQQVLLSGISITGEIDEVVLRDSENNILATGVRDIELPDPGP